MLGLGWVGVVIEYEGVLVESTLDVELAAWKTLAAELNIGREPNEFALRRAQGMFPEHIVSQVLCWTRNPTRVNDIVRRFAALVKGATKEQRLMPGVKAILRSLRNTGDVAFAVVSSSSSEDVRAGLAANGVEDIFMAQNGTHDGASAEAVVVGCDKVMRGRPDPEAYDLAASLMNRYGQNYHHHRVQRKKNEEEWKNGRWDVLRHFGYLRERDCPEHERLFFFFFFFSFSLCVCTYIHTHMKQAFESTYICCFFVSLSVCVCVCMCLMSHRPAHRCIVFGNTNACIEAARDAGMHCVGVASTQPVYELSSADLVVRRLDDACVLNIKKLIAEVKNVDGGGDAGAEFGGDLEPELELETFTEEEEERARLYE